MVWVVYMKYLKGKITKKKNIITMLYIPNSTKPISNKMLFNFNAKFSLITLLVLLVIPLLMTLIINLSELNKDLKAKKEMLEDTVYAQASIVNKTTTLINKMNKANLSSQKDIPVQSKRLSEIINEYINTKKSLFDFGGSQNIDETTYIKALNDINSILYTLDNSKEETDHVLIELKNNIGE